MKKPKIILLQIEMPDDKGTLVEVARLGIGCTNAVDISVSGIISPLSEEHRKIAYEMFEAAEKAVAKVKP